MDFRKPSRATVKVRLLNPHSCTHAHTHSQSFPPPGSFILPSVLTTPYDSRMLRDFTAERAEFVPAGRGCTVDKPLVWSWISLRQRLPVIPDVFYVALLGVHSQSKKKKKKKKAGNFLSAPLRRFTAGVCPPSLPPALTCFLTVFGPREMVGIQPRLDTNLIASGTSGKKS